MKVIRNTDRAKLGMKDGKISNQLIALISVPSPWDLVQSNHLIRARRKRKEYEEDEQESMHACSTNYHALRRPIR